MEKIALTAPILLALLIIAMMFAYLAYGGTILHVTRNSPACISKADFQRAVQFMASGDKEAFIDFMTARVQMGTCTMLMQGQAVYLEDSSWGDVKVRVKGDTVSYWTFTEAVK